MGECYHCGETVPSGVNLIVNIDDVLQPMCCHGCKAVAEYLTDNKHGQFYQFRKEKLPETSTIIDQKWSHLDEASIFDQLTRKVDQNISRVSIKIEDMYCNACSWLLNKALKDIDGIKNVNINAINKLVQVEFNQQQIKLSEIFDHISLMGYHPSTQKNDTDFMLKDRNTFLKRIAVAGFGMMFIMTLAVPLYSDQTTIDPAIRQFFLMVSLMISTVVYVYSGKGFLHNAYRDVANGHMGMDIPIALSISIAYFVSVYLSLFGDQNSDVYFDSMTMFIFLLLIGRFIESQVRHKEMNIRDSLFATLPIDAIKLKSGDFAAIVDAQTIPIDHIQKGDPILINANSTACCDGRIIAGKATFSEALLTGESTEKHKGIGDSVLAGSKALSGQVIIQANGNTSDSFLSQLADMMESAQSRKPTHQKLIDRIAAHFTIVVLSLAVLTFLWYWFNDKNLLIPSVLSVLIATCPCALSLATPAALSAAGIKLQKCGVLVNNTDAITQLAVTNQWLFDKTGTLTSSQLSIHEVIVVNFHENFMEIAHAMQTISSHPIASAFESGHHIDFDALEEVIGCGITGRLNGDVWLMGSHQWLSNQGIDIPKLTTDAALTQIYLAKNNALIALFALNMPLRQGARKLIYYLYSKNKQIRVLSGDNHSAVHSCADDLKIIYYDAEMSSKDKIDKVLALQSQKLSCTMVGDGINDGPILSQANVSISMKTGAALAHSVSDFVVLGEQLSSLINAFKISEKSVNIIKQNIFWSVCYNISVTPMAMMGHLQPWMAAIGMSVSSLIVVFNARRLL